MKTKLTLNIDDAVIDKVKKLSLRRKQSVSSIVEDYLKVLTATGIKTKGGNAISFTQQFRNEFPVKSSPAEVNYKKEYHQHLEKRYAGK